MQGHRVIRVAGTIRGSKVVSSVQLGYILSDELVGRVTADSLHCQGGSGDLDMVQGSQIAS